MLLHWNSDQYVLINTCDRCIDGTTSIHGLITLYEKIISKSRFTIFTRVHSMLCSYSLTELKTLVLLVINVCNIMNFGIVKFLS